MTFRVSRFFSSGEWKYWNPILYNSSRRYRYFYYLYLKQFVWGK